MDPGALRQRWIAVSLSGSFETSDPFMRFIGAWIAFNALYGDICRNVKGDREQVKAFARTPDARRSHQEILLTLPDYKQEIDLLRSYEVKNLDNMVMKISKNDNLVDVLNCIYQVRCNLFHGGKDIDDQRDRDLVKAGFVIVVNLVTKYDRGNIVGGWAEIDQRG